MTLIASIAIVLIAAYALMVICYLSRIIMLVTIDAREDIVIARHIMAIGAGIPLVFMLSGINREVHIIVIESGRIPGCSIMAGLASIREACAYVIRVIC
jgi:hypothetical protein